MLPLFIKAAVIVWREAIEAILIVGVIHAFFVRRGSTTVSFRFLRAGVAVGIILSLVLGGALVGLGDALPADGFAYFQTGLIFVCAVLMTQMVFWMRRHSRAMAQEIERKLAVAIQSDARWPLFFIAMSAVAREGAEAVIYLIGSVAENQGNLGRSATILAVAAAAVVGIGAAWLCVRLVSASFRYLSYKRVFNVTAVWFLCAASALWVTGIERLESLETWPFSTAAIWDLSHLLSEHSVLGGVLRALMGYRDRASLPEFLGWVSFWAVAVLLLRLSAPAVRASVTPGQAPSPAV